MRRPLGLRSEESHSSLSPHVVDHETAHDRAERQAIGMRAPVCSLRRFDFEHEGKKRPVGRADQPPLVFRLAEFGDEGNEGAVRVSLPEAPEHCARPLAGAIRQVEEPVALVAGAAELRSGEGQSRRRWRDQAPIGGSQGALRRFILDKYNAASLPLNCRRRDRNARGDRPLRSTLLKARAMSFSSPALAQSATLRKPSAVTGKWHRRRRAVSLAGGSGGVEAKTTLTGSRSPARGFLSPEAAWRAAHVDENFQSERWGANAEATTRGESR
jgi:hypothetical protein